MSYKMDYRSLKNMYKFIDGNASSWIDALDNLHKSITSLSQDPNISGTGAEALKMYFSTMHLKSIIPAVSQAVNSYLLKFSVYYNDYINNLDTNEDARFHEDEFDYITSKVKRLQKNLCAAENDVKAALRGISDIYPSSRGGAYSNIETSMNAEVKLIEKLDSNIKSLESRHANGDFAELDELIRSTNSLIRETRSKNRNFKTSFTNESFSNLKSSSAFIAANVAVNKELNSNKEKYIEAYNNSQEHVQKLEQLEYEERHRIATAIKIGVAVVAATVLIVATAGGATPLVVGGISAATAVASTASDKMLDEYVEHGNLDKMDWKDFTIDCAVAGATGFISGYIGGGMSKTLKEVGPLSKLVGSEHAIVRIAGNAAIGTTKDIVTGLANNTIKEGGEFIKGNGFHAEKILGLEEGEDINAVNLLKKGGKVVATNVVDSTIGEGFDSYKDKHSGGFNSGGTAKRAAKGAAFGSTKEVVTGMATRATEAAIDGDNIVEKTFDKEDIIKDTVKGGVEEGYSNAKKPSGSDDLYKKQYKGVDKKGNTVVADKKEDVDWKKGQEPQEVYEKQDKRTVPSPKGRQEDVKWVKDGGKIKSDSDGNVIYESSTKTQYAKEHPLKDALKRNFVTGDAHKTTEFYDSDGNYDPSRSVVDYKGGAKVGKTSDVYDPTEQYQKEEYESYEDRFSSDYNPIWKQAV